MEPSEFADRMWSRFGKAEPFQPSAHYDPDGDCLEFLVSDEAFRGERLDKWVTVYRGRSTGRIVGSMIKSIRELLTRNPGLAIEIRSGPVRLSHFLHAPKFSATSEVTVRVYQEIIKEAEDSQLEADLQCAGS